MEFSFLPFCRFETYPCPFTMQILLNAMASPSESKGRPAIQKDKNPIVTTYLVAYNVAQVLGYELFAHWWKLEVLSAIITASLNDDNKFKLLLYNSQHTVTGTCGQDPPPFFLNIDFFFHVNNILQLSMYHCRISCTWRWQYWYTKIFQYC